MHRRARGGRDGDAATATGLSGAAIRGVPGPTTQPADDRLPDLRRHPDPYRPRERERLRVVGLHVAGDRVRRVGWRRPAVLASATRDPVPEAVPTVVVRLVTRAPAGHEPAHLPRAVLPRGLETRSGDPIQDRVAHVPNGEDPL